ncbi:hypothetical protein E2562_023863 [Oryza meyeriana var. granulata]|uniref:Uncharacterized protein n=1 Tax=Oryza meyeriana var. granulata TaxID=110450 RepID=A0A6G1D7G0_9ORYZ|nr:hypothetical protein E2562_023863 [Oryza meyeriana var. granulata]
MSSSGGKEEGGKQMLMSSRILSSRDRAAGVVANASFRVYYSLGAAGTVPFVWESKPGTPKSTVVPASAADDYAVPPISPPPSYQWSCNSQQSSKAKKCRRRLSSSSSSWASSSGGGGGWMSWLMSFRRRRWWSPLPSYRRRWLGQDSGVVVDDVVRRSPRRAIMCFGAGKDHW